MDKKIINLVNEFGYENSVFFVPLRPLRSAFGILAYTSSSDETMLIPCEIGRREKDYHLERNYKVTFIPLIEGFETINTYVLDMEGWLRQGLIVFANMNIEAFKKAYNKE